MLFSNIHISKYSKINNIEINYAEIELEFKEEKEKLTVTAFGVNINIPTNLI